MRNRFPTACIRCDASIPEGEGHFERVTSLHRRLYGEKVRGRKWVGRCRACVGKGHPEEKGNGPMISLTVRVPAKTLAFELLWLKRDFAVMSPSYRKNRAIAGGGLVSCFACGRAFDDGEPFALACVKDSGNKTFCHSCADHADKPDPPGIQKCEYCEGTGWIAPVVSDRPVRLDLCRTCRGAGTVRAGQYQTKTCPDCRGTGAPLTRKEL